MTVWTNCISAVSAAPLAPWERAMDLAGTSERTRASTSAMIAVLLMCLGAMSAAFYKGIRKSGLQGASDLVCIVFGGLAVIATCMALDPGFASLAFAGFALIGT